MMPQPDKHQPQDEAVESAAAEWIARRERGLTAGEEKDFEGWLAADPRHAATFDRLVRAWALLNQLGEHHELHGTVPDPDFLRPTQAHRRFRWLSAGLGLAAAAAIAALVWLRSDHVPAARPPITTAQTRVKVVPAGETRRLPDGSTVSLNGASIEVVFTDGERRVRLTRGEAHFSVAKNPGRPFVVDTGEVRVRAVGTAFDVVRREAAIEVLVTEGKVQVERTALAPGSAAPLPVSAGQRAYVDVRDEGATTVDEMALSDMDRALGWRSARLEFADLPLSDVVAEFNRRNALQLTCGDAETGRVLVGGSFRADNVDAFVRIIEKTAGVVAEKRGDGVVVLKLIK